MKHTWCCFHLEALGWKIRKNSDANKNWKTGRLRGSGFTFTNVWCTAKALEGVQKDVRRTVSVMQYNILASWPAPETFPQQLEIRGETKSKTQIEKRKLHKCLAFFLGFGEVPRKEYPAVVPLWCGHWARGWIQTVRSNTVSVSLEIPVSCPTSTWKDRKSSFGWGKGTSSSINRETVSLSSEVVVFPIKFSD